MCQQPCASMSVGSYIYVTRFDNFYSGGAVAFFLFLLLDDLIRRLKLFSFVHYFFDRIVNENSRAFIFVSCIFCVSLD